MDELFRRYLQTRVSLGEPTVVFRDLDRREARRGARRIALQGVPDSVAARSGETGGAADASRDAAGAEAAGGPSLPVDELERLGREGTAEEIAAVPDLATLAAVVERCRRCPLHETRERAVFGEGSPEARLVCVGEAPGAREDETGRPFVGPAGKLLDQLLLSVGFRREEVYICNVLKSRPPGNRDPEPEEIDACAPYLLRQLELLDPRVIVAFGAFAARTLTGGSGSLGSLRGRVHEFEGYPLVATYHPAALLRNRSWTRPSWEDLQRARRIVDGESPAAATQPGLL